MNDLTKLNPFVLAEAEIDAWRGHCLHLFARAERAIGNVLELASVKDETIKLRHLSGQRLADLQLASGKFDLTAKQNAALQASLEKWKEEGFRAFLAHGVATILLDKASIWYVQLDFTDYRERTCHPRRWIQSKSEAGVFSEDLLKRFSSLSGQLGQMRVRLVT